MFFSNRAKELRKELEDGLLAIVDQEIWSDLVYEDNIIRFQNAIVCLVARWSRLRVVVCEREMIGPIIGRSFDRLIQNNHFWLNLNI